VDDIVAAAKASKGAFYFRFRTKADLLRYLAEDAFEAMSSESSAFLTSAEVRRLSLEDFISEFIEVATRTYTTRRNLLRALLEQTRPGGDIVIAALVRAGSAESARALAAALERRKPEMRCADRDVAIATALVVLGVSVRTSCLFPEQLSSVNGMTAARFRQELVRLVMAYLKPPR
jgi:AcrR family transcriptional regulator